MFWDKVAWIYDLFAYVFNAKVHKVLCHEVAELIDGSDEVLECACGTGMLTVHVAPICYSIIATDLSGKMLKKAAAKCKRFRNATFEYADILHLDYAAGRFNTVIAAGVIHLLGDPLKALAELDRVCKPGGKIIIPTYMNRKNCTGKTSSFTKVVDKTGADFKRQFNLSSYQQFFAEAGYHNVTYKMIDGRVPCAIAVIKK